MILLTIKYVLIQYSEQRITISEFFPLNILEFLIKTVWMKCFNFRIQEFSRVPSENYDWKFEIACKLKQFFFLFFALVPFLRFLRSNLKAAFLLPTYWWNDFNVLTIWYGLVLMNCWLLLINSHRFLFLPLTMIFFKDFIVFRISLK